MSTLTRLTFFTLVVLAACSSPPPHDDDDAATTSDAGRKDAATHDVDDASPTRDAGQKRDGSPERDASLERDASVTVSGATRIDAPPTYQGAAANESACNTTLRTAGHAPADTSDKHPLFLYFMGTSGGSDDASGHYDAQAPLRVTQAMARRGFVALSVEYDNNFASVLVDKRPCMFTASNPDSLLARACTLPGVDCGLGIALWGHSQGAVFAHSAINYDARVKAVWTTGYSAFGPQKLPSSRFRAVNGENDPMNGTVKNGNDTAGFIDSDRCPDDGRDSCLRADGSGWILVRKAACRTNSADHCWFNKRACTDNSETLEPSWADEDSNAAFSIEENADWVASTTRRTGP